MHAGLFINNAPDISLYALGLFRLLVRWGCAMIHFFNADPPIPAQIALFYVNQQSNYMGRHMGVTRIAARTKGPGIDAVSANFRNPNRFY